MAKRHSNTARNVTVDDKLRELGISDDESDRDDESSDDEEQDEEEEDDVEVDEDDELDQVAKADALAADEEPIAPKRSKLRDALFAGDAKPPRVAAPPAAPSAAAAATVTPLPFREEDPVYVVPPERVRKIKREPPPSVKRMGGALARKLPGAERVKIKKRLENGQLGIIGEYSEADLASCSDVETFILKFIKPRYGAGVYKLTGIDATGRELEAGEIPVLDPIEPNSGEGVIGIMSQLLEQTQRQQREMMEASRMQNQQPAVDLIGTLKGLQEVQQNMTAQVAPPAGDGGLASVMAVMIQAMQQQAAQAQAAQQQMTQLLVAAMQPKEDPTLKLLLAKLMEEKSSSGSSMPLPPPPPPTSPLEGLKEIVEVMAVVMGGNKKSTGSDDETKELLKAALAVKKDETLSPREVIQLMHEMQASRGTDDFRKSMENMSMVMQVATNLRGQQEGSSSAGFFDALSALFSNRDFAGSIANSIRAKAEQQAHAARVAQEQALIRARQQLLREARSGAPAGAPGAAAPGQPAVPGQPGAPARAPGTVVPIQRPVAAPAAVAPQQVAPAPNVVVAPPTPVTPAVAEAAAALEGVELPAAELVQPPAPPAPKPIPRIPQLPTATVEHVQGIVHSKSDAELIEKTVRMLIYFAEFPEWRPLTEMLLTMVQRGERERAVTNLEHVVRGMSAMAVMTPELAHRIAGAFSEHFDEIQGGLADIALGGSESDNPFEEALADAEDEDGEEYDDEDEDAEEDEEDDGEGDDEEDEDEDDEEDEDDGAAARP